MDNATAVQFFQDLLSFKTVSQTGHLDGSNVNCVAFLKNAIAEHLPSASVTVLPGPVEGKPVLLATWHGSEPELPSLLLNSHYDVVPVMAEHWTQPAWEGVRVESDAFGALGARIYGRGAQDMKSVCAQYIVALGRLHASGWTPRRNVHLSFVPDEESGGSGMAYLLCHAAWPALNVGCALDEGLCAGPGTADEFTVFYGERTPWWMTVRAEGPTGHGSRFIRGTATHVLHAWLARALAFRKQQEALLRASARTADDGRSGCAHAKCKKLGDVTTVNLTVLEAGVTCDGGATYAINVIPTSARASLDVRVPVTTPHADVAAMFDAWCAEAEAEWDAAPGTISWTWAKEAGATPLQAHHTSTIDESNPWWVTFTRAIEGAGKRVAPEIFPAGTDSRLLRALGICAFGFSPLNRDPILLHEHDEYVSERVFVDGATLYVKLIGELASLGATAYDAAANAGAPVAAT
jgi:aminoacylase